MKRISLRRIRARRELIKDIFFICIGIVIAVLLSKSGFINGLTEVLGGEVLASFASGIFFTSAFTMAPAAVALVHIANDYSMHSVALWGALGAMLGDLALFLFIRDRFADDLVGSLKPSVVKSIAKTFHFGLLKWLSPAIGALLIASPLPDDFALTLMGISKTRVIILLPITFVMNVFNIYLLVWFAGLL